MVSAIQAVPNVDTANIVLNVGRFFQVVSGADTSLPVPSTIVSLGATPALPLTFDATGLFGTATGNIAATPAASSLLPASNSATTNTATGGSPIFPVISPAGTTAAGLTESGVATLAAALATSNPVPGAVGTATATSAAAPASTTPLGAIAATTDTAALPVATVVPAAAAPLTPAVADATGVTQQDNGTSLANTVVDPAVQAQINIQTNPAYASLAAGLYVSVAIYRAQQRDLTDTTHSPQPTAPVSAVGTLVSSTQAGSPDSRWNRSGRAWH